MMLGGFSFVREQSALFVGMIQTVVGTTVVGTIVGMIMLYMRGKIRLNQSLKNSKILIVARNKIRKETNQSEFLPDIWLGKCLISTFSNFRVI